MRSYRLRFGRIVYAVLESTILLARACKTDDVEVSEGDFASLGPRNEMGSATVPIPGKGLTKVTLNTTLMQEKSQVIRSV